MAYTSGIELLTDDTGQGLRLQGDTDGTLIGNAADRLKTNAALTPVPEVDVIHNTEYLLNSSSSDANINGSVTPVVFSYAPASGETWYLRDLSCVLIDDGTMQPDRFGSLGAALTNGILIEVKSKGTTYTICNVKSNLDLALLLGGGGAGGGSGSFLGLGSGAGFFDEDDVFKGSFSFGPPVKLQNLTTDLIRITVRDNLTGITFLRFSINKWKTI